MHDADFISFLLLLTCAFCAFCAVCGQSPLRIAQLAFGRLAKHYMIKDVITVAPDGMSAKGRFDYLSMGGAFDDDERTGNQIGIYNLSFLKEDGVWKLSKFWVAFDTINYNHRDWATNPAMCCPNPSCHPTHRERSTIRFLRPA